MSQRKEALWPTIRKQFIGNTARVFGFALCLVWVFVASHNLSISISVALIEGLSARCVLLMGTAVGAVFLLLYSKKREFPNQALLVASITYMSIGFLMYVLPDTLDIPETVSMFCVFMSGCGYGILFLAWVSSVDRNDPKGALAFFGLTILCASMVDAVVIMMPFYLILAIMLCLPVLSMILYIKSRVRHDVSWEDKQEEGGRNAGQYASMKDAGAIGGRAAPYSKVALAAVILPLIVEGFAYGAFTQLVFYLNASLENIVGVAALAITAVLLIASVLIFPQMIRNKTLLFAFFILLAAGYSLIPLFSADIKLVVFILMLSYNFFYFLALAFCDVFSCRIGVPFPTCLTIAVLLFSGADALGTVFGGLLSGFLQLDQFYTAMSVVAVYSFLVAAFVAIQFFFDTQDTVKPSVENLVETKHAYAKARKFSHRETEVFLLLVRGRTAEVIAEKLFISSETVRVHIKNIYRKAGIHSQQDLIDELEKFEGEQ